jgi:hypothetical protein
MALESACWVGRLQVSVQSSIQSNRRTVLKLIILKITNRPVLQTCVPTREFDPTVLSTEQLKPGIASMPAGSPLHNHLLPLLPSLPPSHQVHPLSLLPELRRPADQLAEIIASTSTFLYLLLLLRAQQNRPVRHRPLSLPTLSSSLSPFLITFMLQLLARRLRSRPTTELQAAHYGQLDRALASWLVKGPLWVGWTRPKIMRVVGALERIPILGLVGGFIGDYVPLVDDYFYCTSLNFPGPMSPLTKAVQTLVARNVARVVIEAVEMPCCTVISLGCRIRHIGILELTAWLMSQSVSALVRLCRFLASVTPSPSNIYRRLTCLDHHLSNRSPDDPQRGDAKRIRRGNCHARDSPSGILATILADGRRDQRRSWELGLGNLTCIKKS